jgi:hypothetical protein
MRRRYRYINEPDPKFKSALTEAFKKLRRYGYFARQNFTCCQSCGWAEVPDAKSERAVFYHRQDTEGMLRGRGCMLAWSGDGEEIVAVLREVGIEVEWDGTANTRILAKGLAPAPKSDDEEYVERLNFMLGAAA